MPAWLYTIGNMLMNDAGFKIHFFGLFLNLLVLILPCVIGYKLGHYLPVLKKIAIFANKIFTSVVPLMLTAILLMISRFYAIVYIKNINIITGY